MASAIISYQIVYPISPSYMYAWGYVIIYVVKVLEKNLGG